MKAEVCSSCMSALMGKEATGSLQSLPLCVPLEEKERGEPPLKVQKLSTTPPTTPPPVSHPSCQYCLDLFDVSKQIEMIDKIICRYKEEDYVGLRTFHLCITLPSSLTLHHRLTQLILSKNKERRHLVSFSDSFKDTLKFELVRELSSRLNLTTDKDSPFKINLLFTHNESEDVYTSFIKRREAKILHNRSRKRHKITYTHDIVNKCLEGMDHKEVDNYFPSSLPSLSTLPSLTVQFYHEPIFIGGRYNKYSRELSQSPWVIDGVRKSQSSIQEILTAETGRVFRSDTIRFSSSGREDIDVRMLGSGRPFMLELVNPRLLSYEEIQSDLEDSINKSTSDIAVRDLKMVDKKTSLILKTGEEEKEKLYSALIWTSQVIEPESLGFLNEVSNLHISQKTPVRVLHRRSLATRERIIYSLKATWIDPNHFQLDLTTQAGTYIKEFVHGDLGRTVPNLSNMMGQNVDIVALDVLEIKLEWPL